MAICFTTLRSYAIVSLVDWKEKLGDVARFALYTIAVIVLVLLMLKAGGPAPPP